MKKKRIPDPIPKRYFTVLDSIFKQRIHILLNHTPEQYQKWLNKNRLKDDNINSPKDFVGSSCSFETEKGKTEWIIHISRFDWAIRHQGTLIHEIVHTIIKIWSFNNIPYNNDTQEFLAHSIANLYEDIAEKLLV